MTTFDPGLADATLVDRMLRESGTTTVKAARALGLVPATLSNWRHGKRAFTLRRLRQLARVCGYELEVRAVSRPTELGRGVVARPAAVRRLGATLLDAEGHPWVLTHEGWAPGRGNPLRVRLSSQDLDGLHGPTWLPRGVR